MIEKVQKRLIQFYNPLKNSYKYVNLKKSEATFKCAQDERSKLIKFINLVNSLTSANKIYRLAGFDHWLRNRKKLHPSEPLPSINFQDGSAR